MMEKYGEKVYKIPISISTSCPNRDGTLGTGGCTFCGEAGAGHETLSQSLSPQEQFDKNVVHIRNKYKAKRFIPYFQDFTNTYMAPAQFRSHLFAIEDPSVAGVALSTRPDCLSVEYMDILKELSQERGWDIYLELGLQTVNYRTLKKINRGHTLAEFLEGVILTRSYGFDLCVHMILNLPWDDREDCIEGAKILSALGVNGVKLHALYIEEGTKMAQEYIRGDWSMISLEEYVERVVTFLSYLSPEIAVHRLIGRAPEEGTLFVNWNRSWWVIRDQIEKALEEKGLHQGILCDYLGGKGVRSFIGSSK